MNGFAERQELTMMLARQLRELRRRLGLSGKDLAAGLGWHASRVSRFENARQVPTAQEVTAWGAFCRVSKAEAAQLAALRRRVETVHRDWRQRMRRGLAGVQADYNRLVAGARLVRHLEVAWIPGSAANRRIRPRSVPAARRLARPASP
jgi:transcriptional regulator with XRE-family HTH domain